MEGEGPAVNCQGQSQGQRHRRLDYAAGGLADFVAPLRIVDDQVEVILPPEAIGYPLGDENE